MASTIEELKEAVAGAKKIVFFGGAGVSTESGIPDFRSVDGLYNQKYDYPPETILSHTFFMRHTEEFYKFYRDKMLCTDAEPNAAHLKLAEWERAGKLNAVITQNIDGLHQKAGSRHVLELHGSVLRNFCMKCGKAYDLSVVTGSEGVPKCPECGGTVKPDVVLYEESLDSDVLTESVRCIREADLMIIGGTSLAVYRRRGSSTISITSAVCWHSSTAMRPRVTGRQILSFTIRSERSLRRCNAKHNAQSPGSL